MDREPEYPDKAYWPDCRMCQKKLEHKHKCVSTLVCEKGSQFVMRSPLNLWKGADRSLSTMGGQHGSQ